MKRSVADELESIVNQFELEWKPQISVVDFFSSKSADPENLDLFRELALVDMEMRWNRGQHVSVEDYSEAFPAQPLADEVLLDLLEAEIGLSRRNCLSKANQIRPIPPSPTCLRSSYRSVRTKSPTSPPSRLVLA